MEAIRENLIIEDIDPSGERRVRAFDKVVVMEGFGTPVFCRETDRGRKRIELGFGYRVYSFEGFLKDKFIKDYALMAHAITVAADARRDGGCHLPFDTKIKKGYI